MTKYFRLMTMVLLLVLPVSAGASFWPATGLTGGVANQDLDEIDGALLGEGHVSMTIVDGFVYFHYLDATSGAGESSPDIISPDSNAGTKRWELVEVVAFGFDARDENITNVGNLALDSLSSDDGTDIVVTLGADAGDDFNIDSGGFVYEGDANTTTIGSLIATTADINAGTMDNTVIGGGTAVAGSFAAVVATSLSNTEGNITNVSDIALDSISSDASTTITITLGNDAGDDLVVNSNTLNVSGDTDNLGFGSAASADYFITSSPTWTSTGSGTESAVIQIGGTMTGANGDTAYLTGIEFLTTHTTQGAAEAIGVVSQVRITEPNITIGTATVTESATLHIVSAASEATRDYSLFVDAGDARFDGNVMIGETVPDEMLHITSSTSAKPVAKIENTNADALSGSIGFYKIATGSAADDDVLGRVDFNALDSGDNATLFGAIIVESSDVTDAAESGVIRLAPMVNGTARDLFNAGGEDTNASDPVEVVVNEDSIDADFRVESDGDAAAFVIEGSSSNVTISTGDLKFSGDGSGVPFASIYGNDIGWTQAAAVQNTWYDIVDADMTTSELNELTHDGNGLITIITAGRYSIAWSITLSADTINHHYEGGIELDDGGSAEAPGQSHYEISNIAALANSDFPMSSVAILDLAASTTVEIAVRTTGAGTPDISVDHVNVVVTMEGGT